MQRSPLAPLHQYNARVRLRAGGRSCEDGVHIRALRTIVCRPGARESMPAYSHYTGVTSRRCPAAAAPAGPLADARLGADTRGCDGGSRKASAGI
jgi:hypothetical protein